MTQTLEAPITEALVKISQDIRESADLLSPQEIRYLVDIYYEIQHFRIATNNQMTALGRDGEPVRFVSWVFDSMESVERSIKNALNRYTDTEPSGMGAWAKEIVGIGPVISAGLLANIDITKAPTAGHVWRFAGLDPTVKWGKGEKRPWNASLKRLCWLVGESFVKVQNNERDVYGKLYAQRKAKEMERNESGQFTDQATASLEAKRFGKDTVARAAYESGKLPQARIHLRATRWAVKIFLSHWQAEAYRRHYGTEPPAPYAIAIQGHAHVIKP